MHANKSCKNALCMFSCGIILLVCYASGCAGKESDVDMLKRDHEAISKILDKALLGDDPQLALKNSLEKVRSFSSVDSAWISGSSFFVKYKQGGKVSWTVPPPVH